MTDDAQDIDAYLASIERDACYRVDAVLKESLSETTERVYFVGANGAEQGPYVRKRFDVECGMGGAYRRIMEAQRAGRRFLHLPRVLDCYSDGRTLSVVMEYVAGETLGEVVYRCDPSLALAIDLVPRLCDAASELHEAFDPPIIHRDLKPSNVVVTADALALIDFGIARTFRADAEDDTRHFGTRAYAPPEQFGFGQTSVRSDVYALGMLAYYCLAEKTPTNEVRESGFEVNEVPAALRPVLAKATAFDPAARYASAREFKAAFEVAAAKARGAREGAEHARHVSTGGGNGAFAASSQRGAQDDSFDTYAKTPGESGLNFSARPNENGSAQRTRFHAAITVLRDVVAVGGLCIWAAAAIACAVDPAYYEPSMLQQGTSHAVIAVQFALMAIAGLPVAWLVFDRAHLACRFPGIPRWLIHRVVVKCVAAVLLCLLAVGVVGVVT